ncbi:hypothetical protein F5Y05DRAFT_421003 [Hypoxylon sp. FL0543]|nr:hypothetical protein F5Y05DRAFT_421003 [Hypoxylon sp. FL0543]
MANSKQLRVPVGIRLSIGIELEFLVAWLPPGEKDPFEIEAGSLPPLLRIDSEAVAESTILGAMRSTLRKHGIPVFERAAYMSGLDTPRPTIDHPLRLQDKDKWSFETDSSVSERLNKDYAWGVVECRSPAMWARPESFQEIAFVVNILTSSHRLRLNPTCGFHVHVGNGKWYFPAADIKRLGAFLWAADPMISRLHPAWRRVAHFSRSIRYDSKLAQGATVKSVEAEIIENLKRPLGEVDPIPVTDYSDTTREEIELGGKEKWQEFARWRNEVGPFMTLGEVSGDSGSSAHRDDDNDGADSHRTARGRNDSSTGGASNHGGDAHLPLEDFLSPIPEPEYNLPSVEEMAREGERLLDEDWENEGPPDRNTLHRNVGWVHWDELQPIEAAVRIREYCEVQFGHRNLEKLSSREQLTLMFITQCALLFGHINLEELTKDQEYQVLVASSPYIEAARSRWDWNPATEQFERNWQRMGHILEHTSAQREIKIDAPYIVQKFENLAKLMELNGEDSDFGIEYTHREEQDKATQTNRGIQELLESLKDYADSPGPHYLENLTDPHAALYKAMGLAPPKEQPEEREAPRADERTEHERGPDTSSPAYPVSIHSLDDAADTTGGSFHPPAWDAMQDEQTRYASLSSPASHGSETKPRSDKLLPHDVDVLSMSYKGDIRRYAAVTEKNWDEVRHPPYATNPLAEAAASSTSEEPPPDGSVHVTTAEGLAQIASAPSALVAAELLVPAPEYMRLNYNFSFYRLASLRGAGAGDKDAAYTANLRTIEFREAAGTLDARWILTWACICVGMVRWARCASVSDFMDVLDRIIAQEERELRRLAASGAPYEAQERDEAARYDVCDLLEDIGLFAEAAWVRKRESERGPPM